MEVVSVSYNEACIAYENFIKGSKGFLGISFGKDDNLKNFSEVQKENDAYNSIYLKVRNVPLDNIKGSVQKYTDFNQNFVPKDSVLKDRWCKIYIAFLNNEYMPPVQLYKIKDDYFVYDGNHRISVAKYLKLDSIEAEVREFLPSSDTKENVIYREKFIFEKTTGLENIILTEPNQYNRLIKEINDYKEYLQNKELKEVNFIQTSKLWYEKIYCNAIKILEEEGLLENYENRTLPDLFIYFLDHKYYESEKHGHDVGFSYAIVDFINLIKSNKDINIENKIKLDENIIKHLKLLYEVDKRKYLNPDILKKSDILKEYTNLEFDHNFLLLFEIDDYIEKNNILDFKEGVKKWYEDNFIKKINILEQKVKYLPEIYSNKIDLLLKDREKLFYSLQNYNQVCNKDESFDYSSIISDYIIQIYIPIIDILIKKGINNGNYLEIYYGIYGKYIYLLKYKKDVTMKEASDMYFKSEGKKYQKIHDWFLDKFDNTSKSEIFIDYMIGKLEMTISDTILFRKILEKYSKPKKYGTIFKLAMVKDNFERQAPLKDWLRDRFIPDLETMTNQKDIMIFFKTKSVMEKFKKEEDISLIDFYADVTDYGNYIGKDLSNVNIVDLVMEYKKNNI